MGRPALILQEVISSILTTVVGIAGDAGFLFHMKLVQMFDYQSLCLERRY